MGTKINSAVSWAVKIANDSSHGYDQINRWGPDYDCSSLVISAYQQAGVKVKDKGATYTGNMLGVFIACGFINVTSKINLITGSGLQKGDVLLNQANHTAMMIDSKNLVQASINEKGGISGGKAGDQTGKEIYTRTYYNYPWDCVLRYSKDGESTTADKTTSTTATATTNKTSDTKTVSEIAKEVIAGKWGNGDERKKKLTAAGYDYSKVQSAVETLLSGSATSAAVKYKITADVLNIRSGAGTSYKIVGTVKQGEVYTIVETKSGWGKLKSGAGWISLSYAKKV
jgi:hypothetical protein